MGDKLAGLSAEELSQVETVVDQIAAVRAAPPYQQAPPNVKQQKAVPVPTPAAETPALAPIAPKVERKPCAPMPEINMKNRGTAEDVKVLLAHLQTCWQQGPVPEPVSVADATEEVPDNAIDELRDITTRMAKAGTAPHMTPQILGSGAIEGFSEEDTKRLWEEQVKDALQTINTVGKV